MLKLSKLTSPVKHCKKQTLQRLIYLSLAFFRFLSLSLSLSLSLISLLKLKLKVGKKEGYIFNIKKVSSKF